MRLQSESTWRYVCLLPQFRQQQKQQQQQQPVHSKRNVVLNCIPIGHIRRAAIQRAAADGRRRGAGSKKKNRNKFPSLHSLHLPRELTSSRWSLQSFGKTR